MEPLHVLWKMGHSKNIHSGIHTFPEVLLAFSSFQIVLKSLAIVSYFLTHFGVPSFFKSWNVVCCVFCLLCFVPFCSVGDTTLSTLTWNLQQSPHLSLLTAEVVGTYHRASWIIPTFYPEDLVMKSHFWSNLTSYGSPFSECWHINLGFICNWNCVMGI